MTNILISAHLVMVIKQLPNFKEDVNRFTHCRKGQNSVLNIKFIPCSNCFILDWMHKLSTRI